MKEPVPEKKFQVLRRQRPWRTAYYYLKADALYRMTYVFCQRFLPAYGDRTVYLENGKAATINQKKAS